VAPARGLPGQYRRRHRARFFGADGAGTAARAGAQRHHAGGGGADTRMRFILLTGLSGAGKTTSLRYLEDMGCPYVDNLPPAMILRFMELWTQSSPGTRTIVMAVDIRSGDLFDAHALWNLVSATRS